MGISLFFLSYNCNMCYNKVMLEDAKLGMKMEDRKQKMTGELYICHTVYHFLVAMAHWDQTRPVTFWLSTTILKAQKLAEKIKESGAPVTVLVKDKEVLQSEYGFYAKSLLGDYLPFFQSFNPIYLFNDDTPEGFFCHRKKIPYHLLEDGYNYFTIAHQDGYPKTLKGKLARQLKRRPLIRGYSPACQVIEINSRENLAIAQTDNRWPKLRELSRKSLFTQLTPQKQAYLEAIFGPVMGESRSGRLALVLTQPLAQDGFMSSEQQENFYTQLVKKLQKLGYQVLFKAHPRDEMAYVMLEGMTPLPQEIPLEYLALKADFPLSLVVSHSSTANQFFDAPTTSQVFYDWATGQYDRQLLQHYGLSEGDLR